MTSHSFNMLFMEDREPNAVDFSPTLDRLDELEMKPESHGVDIKHTQTQTGNVPVLPTRRAETC